MQHDHTDHARCPEYDWCLCSSCAARRSRRSDVLLLHAGRLPAEKGSHKQETVNRGGIAGKGIATGNSAPHRMARQHNRLARCLFPDLPNHVGHIVIELPDMFYLPPGARRAAMPAQINGDNAQPCSLRKQRRHRVHVARLRRHAMDDQEARQTFGAMNTGGYPCAIANREHPLTDGSSIRIVGYGCLRLILRRRALETRAGPENQSDGDCGIRDH